MGLFVAIEGGDGSGKATQTAKYYEYAKTRGYTIEKLSFPRYGEPSAYYVERYLNGDYGQPDDVSAELGSLPYAIDRFAASSEIRKQLEKPEGMVISDRYIASNLAHQGAKIDDAKKRKVFYERTMLTEYEVLGIPRPTINIVLIMPTALAQQNVDKKSARSYTILKRDIHEADANHLEKAKRNFEELCALYPKEFQPVYCTDKRGDLRPMDEIHKEICGIIDRLHALS